MAVLVICKACDGKGRASSYLPTFFSRTCKQCSGIGKIEVDPKDKNNV